MRYPSTIPWAPGEANHFQWGWGGGWETGLGDVELLGDVDSLQQWTAAAPEEAKALAERTGVKPEDVLGKIRSITYRARKVRQSR